MNTKRSWPFRKQSYVTVVVAAAVVGLLAGCAAVAQHEPAAARAGADVPWWKREKIRFMWGKWIYFRLAENVEGHSCELPREVFRNIAQAGGTVYAELQGYRPGNARLVHELGMKYFATTFLDVAGIPDGRRWVMASGEEHSARMQFKCPLDEASYEKWIVEPHLEGVRDGHIDGIHFDWEGYAGRGEGGICYCDHCFSRFLEIQSIRLELPEKAKRFELIKDRGLMAAYEKNFHRRRIAMFTRIRETLQAANPRLLFSFYNMLVSDFSEAMNTPETPFIVVDSRGYYNDDRQPWWESYGAWLRKRGYLYLPGGWTNALFGAQPSQVSAARWIYEASINGDGCWLWFERELDDEIMRAYATADQQIKAVQGAVGDFLFRGERDPNFVTAVEWTGRPELEAALIHQTYHLGNEHLAHVSNVHSDWPLRARVRFSRLTAGRRWRLEDPLRGLYYTRDGESAVWTTAELRAGVVLAMEPRSDSFLLISRADGSLAVDRSRLVHSREFSALPGHGVAAAQAGRDTAEAATPADGAAPRPADRLVYTVTEPMGFEGPEGSMTIGNVIRTVAPDDEGELRQSYGIWRYTVSSSLRRLRGHLWSPQYSPDGQCIAFVHDAGGRGQIFVMNADGSGAVNVSENAFCDRVPRWAPDGARIAFVSDRGGDWDIHVMNADGTDQRRLAGNPGVDRAPAWAPDGTRIAWESHTSGMPNVWVCGADGADARPVITPGQPMTIRAAYTSGIVDVEPFVKGNAFYLTTPIWSPDGRRIAGVGVSGEHMVYVLAADGSAMLQVIPWTPFAGELCWSPDGKQLAGVSRCFPQEAERTGIFVVDAETGEKRFLVQASPRGPRLGGARRHGVHTWYSNGSARPRRVLRNFTSLAWSPDSKRLAFSSDMEPIGLEPSVLPHGYGLSDPNGAFFVYTIAADGGEPRRLDGTMSAWPQQVMWRPSLSR